MPTPSGRSSCARSTTVTSGIPRVQAQGGRETADPGTDDDDLHTASLLM